MWWRHSTPTLQPMHVVRHTLGITRYTHDSHATLHTQFRDAGSLTAPNLSISSVRHTLVQRWLAATAAPRAGAATDRLITAGASFCEGRTAPRGRLRTKSVPGKARRTTADIKVGSWFLSLPPCGVPFFGTVGLNYKRKKIKVTRQLVNLSGVAGVRG